MIYGHLLHLALDTFRTVSPSGGKASLLLPAGSLTIKPLSSLLTTSTRTSTKSSGISSGSGMTISPGYFLAGSLPGLKAAQDIATIPTCSIQELKQRIETESPFLLDVRDIKNWRTVGHIRGARQIYIGELPGHISEIPGNEPVIICCDAGYKGGLGASILARHRYRNVTNVLGGMTAWKQAGYPVEL